jgi:hypothetical protein
MLAPSVFQFLVQRALIDAQQKGLRIDAQGISGLRFGIAADEIQAWIPVPIRRGHVKEFPVLVEMKDVRGRMTFPVLTPWRVGALLTAESYKGAVSAKVSAPFAAPRLNLAIEHFSLSEHPQLSALGVESGSLSLAITGLPLKPTLPDKASYQVKATDLTVRAPPIIQSLARIDYIRDATLEAVAVVESSGKFSLSKSSLRSSLGEVTLSAQGKLSQTLTLEDLSGSLAVRLSGADSDKLAPWIPVITQQQVDASAKSFTCAIRSAACQRGGAGLELRIGPRCIRVSCS